MLSLSVLSFRSFSFGRLVSLLCDEIVLLEDVIGRRLLFKALLPRMRVLLARIAGLPAVKIESPENKVKFFIELKLYQNSIKISSNKSNPIK
jgi:hypothetical protein